MRLEQFNVIHPGSPGAPPFRVLSGGGKMPVRPAWSLGAERRILPLQAVEIMGAAQYGNKDSLLTAG